VSGYPELQNILLTGLCAVSHADSLLRALGRLWGKSKFTDGDALWVTFLGQRAGNSLGRRKHLLFLGVPHTGGQAETQLWSGKDGLEGVETRGYPYSASAPNPLPWDGLLVSSAGSVPPLVFCPTVALPFSFPFSWLYFSFSCSFCGLSSGPFSSHCQLFVCPWVPSWPPGHAAPREGRALGWRRSREISLQCSWRGFRQTHSPMCRAFQAELSRCKANCCISSLPLEPVQPERDTLWTLPAPLSRLSYFRAGSFCSCPGISRVRTSEAPELSHWSGGIHLRKDWIIQFKGRRSLFSGGSSKSPEFLPKLGYLTLIINALPFRKLTPAGPS